jgi:hypothetical protein
MSSMSDECMQSMQATHQWYLAYHAKATHLAHQQKVNAELWYRWNLADHAKAVNENGWDCIFETTIFSAGVEDVRLALPQPEYEMPPPLPMGYSICSRRWGQEQKYHLAVRIGEIIFAKDGTGRWDTSGFCITYAMERVDEPRRWNKYCVHHLQSEDFADVIRQHTE